MTKAQPGLEPAQVLDALRNDAPCQLSAQQQERLLSRIEASVVAVGAAALVGNAVSNGGTIHAGLETPISLTDRLSAQLATHPVSTLVSMVALGGALGAGTYASVTPRHHQAITAPVSAGHVVAQAPAAAAPGADKNTIISIGDLPRIAATPTATDKSPANQRANAAAGKQWSESAASPAVSAQAPGLAEQLALLETARTAIRQRDAAAAMRALDSHAKQFTQSALSEEREALTIRALAMANRVSEAKGRLAQFEAAFPGSLLLPSLKQSLGNYP